MIESLIVGIVVALISAITFIAYRHPSAYERMYMQAVSFTIMAAFFICAWQLGVITSSAMTIAQLATKKDIATSSVVFDNAITLVKNLKLLGVTIVAAMSVFAYLYILRRLRQILPDEPPNNSSKRTR